MQNRLGDIGHRRVKLIVHSSAAMGFRAKWFLLAMWVPANCFGFALGEFAGRRVGAYGFLGKMPDARPAIGAFVIVGTAAIMQWLVLRQWTTRHPLLWTIASAIGGGVAYEFGVIAFLLFPAPLTGGWIDVKRAVGGAAGGVALGLIQWFLLRHAGTRTKWWPAANALAYGIAVPVFWNVWRFGETLRYAALGGVTAGITVWALIFILHFRSEPHDESRKQVHELNEPASWR